MSFGGNESTSNTKSQANSFLDPTQTALSDNNYVNLSTQVQNPGSDLSYKPYTGPGLNFGDQSTLNGLTTYQAPTATATTYNPATVSTGQTAGDTAALMNPYTSNVVDTTAAQLSRQNNIDNTNAAGQATAAGAFGGSRSAVLQNLNTDSYQRNLDSTVAGLNQQGYTQAQQTALGLEQGNQQAQNQGLQFGAGAQNTASLANQQADIASATQRAQAVGLSSTQAEALFGANWASYLNSQTDPQALQTLVNQALSITPQGPLQQSSSQGSSQSAGFNYGPVK